MRKSYSKLILDSSVIIKWLNQIDEANIDQAHSLLDKLELGVINASTPVLAKFEVGNALLKGKQLVPPEADDALNAFYKLPLNFVDFNENLASETFWFAYNQNITFYDASFVVLARSYECPLVTANPKHQQKFPGVKVIPLKDYK